MSFPEDTEFLLRLIAAKFAKLLPSLPDEEVRQLIAEAMWKDAKLVPLQTARDVKVALRHAAELRNVHPDELRTARWCFLVEALKGPAAFSDYVAWNREHRRLPS